MFPNLNMSSPLSLITFNVDVTLACDDDHRIQAQSATSVCHPGVKGGLMRHFVTLKQRFRVSNGGLSLINARSVEQQLVLIWKGFQITTEVSFWFSDDLMNAS